MDLQTLIALIGPKLSEEGIETLKGLLADLSTSAEEPWKKTTLALIAQAVATHGPQGMTIARAVINDALAGKSPAMDWADLRTASDILAQMQQAEADQHSVIKDYLTKVSYVLGLVLSGVIQGLAE